LKKVAISACLLGHNCRYNAQIKRDDALIQHLEGVELVAFCPEDFCYGTPRPSMDLVETDEGKRAISNLTGADLTPSLVAYAQSFFHLHPDIDLVIGKDRSPSCGVKSAKVYDRDKNLLSTTQAGIMMEEAIKRGIEAIDAEAYLLAPLK